MGNLRNGAICESLMTNSPTNCSFKIPMAFLVRVFCWEYKRMTAVDVITTTIENTKISKVLIFLLFMWAMQDRVRQIERK
jgi:hypothetical protein